VTTGSEHGAVAPADAVGWHDAECGAYAADLPVWDELTRPGAPVLELGAGTGRVTIHLARGGREVTAVERDPDLASELERRVRNAGVEAAVVPADIRELRAESLGRRPAQLIAPMHVVQLFDRTERGELIEAAARLLAPGGTMAIAVIDEAHLTSLAQGEPVLYPDIREIDGWVFSSEPLWVQMDASTITARRLRRRVAPDGALEASVQDVVLFRTPPEEIEGIGEALGLRVRERRRIETSGIESDSTVVVLESP
jgi:SAM-dependent methyltransferase